MGKGCWKSFVVWDESLVPGEVMAIGAGMGLQEVWGCGVLDRNPG